MNALVATWCASRRLIQRSVLSVGVWFESVHDSLRNTLTAAPTAFRRARVRASLFIESVNRNYRIFLHGFHRRRRFGEFRKEFIRWFFFEVFIVAGVPIAIIALFENLSGRQSAGVDPGDVCIAITALSFGRFAGLARRSTRATLYTRLVLIGYTALIGVVGLFMYVLIRFAEENNFEEFHIPLQYFILYGLSALVLSIADLYVSLSLPKDEGLSVEDRGKQNDKTLSPGQQTLW